MPSKQKILILYGGKSAEHEISCRSAAFILENLDKERYDVHTIAIDQAGNWLPQDTEHLRKSLADKKLSISSRVPLNEMKSLPAELSKTVQIVEPLQLRGENLDPSPPVVFPILHGTFGEDGTIQGMFEMANLPFVGADTLGSSIAMDKVVAKKLVESVGVPIVPFVEIRSQSWDDRRSQILEDINKNLRFPLFIKPAKLGSSIGISKANNESELKKSITLAFEYDDKILIENGMDVREIELAALGEYEPMISVPGEIIPHDEFYTFEAKYINETGASIKIPADLEDDQIEHAQNLSKEIFKALNLFGMARIDLFLEKSTQKFFFNEANTIPGFTEISQFPMLWKASGIDSSELLEKLINLALKRHQDRKKLKRTRI